MRAESASMRPRVFPAEDMRTNRRVRGAVPASMRPRVFPAEDAVPPALLAIDRTASMRPRVFPAEDGCKHPGRNMGCHRFNEAAGIPRGRPGQGCKHQRKHGRFNEAAGIPRGRLVPLAASLKVSQASMRPRVFPAEDTGDGAGRIPAPHASMRPRVFPAEDAPCTSQGPHRCGGFNEAAGIPRGRRHRNRRTRGLGRRFNEAAGIPRGRHPRIGLFTNANILLQ